MTMGNTYTSSFTTAATSVLPGKVLLVGDSPEVSVFNKKQSGDLMTPDYILEELEMRRQGKIPSKEFLKEKRRRSMEHFKLQQKQWYEKANSVVSE